MTPFYIVYCVLLSMAWLTTRTYGYKNITFTISPSDMVSYNTTTVVFPEALFTQFYGCMCSKNQISCAAESTNTTDNAFLINTVLTKEATTDFTDTNSNFTAFICVFNKQNMTVTCSRLDLDLQSTSCETNNSNLQAIHMNKTESCDFTCIGILWNNEMESLSFDSDIESIECGLECPVQQTPIPLPGVDSTSATNSNGSVTSPPLQTESVETTSSSPQTTQDGSSPSGLPKTPTTSALTPHATTKETSTGIKPDTSGSPQQDMTSTPVSQTSNPQHDASAKTIQSTTDGHSAESSSNAIKDEDNDASKNDDNSSLIVGSVFACMVLIVAIIVVLVLLQKKFRVWGMMRKRYEELSVNFTNSPKGENMA